jgi:hypothetical protein
MRASQKQKTSAANPELWDWIPFGVMHLQQYLHHSRALLAALACSMCALKDALACKAMLRDSTGDFG